ncbi:MAG: hypothetical protein AB7E42_03345 [Anaerotignaceae bacterium]
MADIPMYRQEDIAKWDLVHTIINMAKQAKGLPLNTEINPYKGKVGKRKKKEN